MCVNVSACGASFVYRRVSDFLLLAHPHHMTSLDAPSSTIDYGSSTPVGGNYTSPGTVAYPTASTYGCHEPPRWQSQQCVMWGTGSGTNFPTTYEQRPMLHPICGQSGTILLRTGAQGHLQQVRLISKGSSATILSNVMGAREEVLTDSSEKGFCLEALYF